jgi:hypothetical protein
MFRDWAVTFRGVGVSERVKSTLRVDAGDAGGMMVGRDGSERTLGVGFGGVGSEGVAGAVA